MRVPLHSVPRLDRKRTDKKRVSWKTQEVFGGSPSLRWSYNQARANVQRRSATRRLIPIALAASTSARPAKNRSFTNSAQASSSEASSCRASSTMSRSSLGQSVAICKESRSIRRLSPPRLSRFLSRARLTRIRRMASAAAPKKCPRLFQRWAFSTSTRRKYASWTRAVAWSVCPGCSLANFAAASFRNSSDQGQELLGGGWIARFDLRQDLSDVAHI